MMRILNVHSAVAAFFMISALAASAREVKVMSYNVRFGTAGDGPNDWKNRRELMIARLYRTETQLREHPELERSAYRQEHAAPVLDQIKKILDREQSRHLPQSSFGKAIKYMIERWAELNLYLEHATLEIDNNLVENAIRPTAIVKKNFLFLGSPNSGQTSAVIYSLVETCRKLDINPSDYLKELFDALPNMQQSEAAVWTPVPWKAAQGQVKAPVPVG